MKSHPAPVYMCAKGSLRPQSQTRIYADKSFHMDIGQCRRQEWLQGVWLLSIAGAGGGGGQVVCSWLLFVENVG